MFQGTWPLPLTMTVCCNAYNLNKLKPVGQTQVLNYELWTHFNQPIIS